MLWYVFLVFIFAAHVAPNHFSKEKTLFWSKAHKFGIFFLFLIDHKFKKIPNSVTFVKSVSRSFYFWRPWCRWAVMCKYFLLSCDTTSKVTSFWSLIRCSDTLNKFILVCVTLWSFWRHWCYQFGLWCYWQNWLALHTNWAFKFCKQDWKMQLEI